MSYALCMIWYFFSPQSWLPKPPLTCEGVLRSVMCDDDSSDIALSEPKGNTLKFPPIQYQWFNKPAVLSDDPFVVNLQMDKQVTEK